MDQYRIRDRWSCVVGPCFACVGEGVWYFRVWGYGLHATTRPPLFSERHGYRRTVRVGRWRVRLLRRGK